jgi:uncharacterized DUF497 family protein
MKVEVFNGRRSNQDKKAMASAKSEILVGYTLEDDAHHAVHRKEKTTKPAARYIIVGVKNEWHTMAVCI